jgi:hypothetical protein
VNAARLLGVGVLAAAMLASEGQVCAQSAGEYPRSGRVEIGAGIVWTGAASLADGDADLIGNQTSSSPYTLFTTATRLAATTGFEGRVGYLLTKALAVEGTFSLARPSLETAVSGDAENAAPVTASERVSEYTIEAGVVLHLTRWRLGKRGVPFVRGGVGYLRQLHQGRELVETGQVFSAGGGVKYVLVERASGVVKGLGLRGEARLFVRRGGIDLKPGLASHAAPAVAASVFVHF